MVLESFKDISNSWIILDKMVALVFKVQWACIAAYYNTTGKCSPCTDRNPLNSFNKLVGAEASHYKHNYTMLETSLKVQ